MKNTYSVGFVSLGCDKNRVDTEFVISKLSMYDTFTFSHNKQKSDIIIVNTCAFLASARKEAENVIKEMSAIKHKPIIIVMGCLPLYKMEGLPKKFPKVSAFVTPKDYERIDEIIFDLLKHKNFVPQRDFSRRLTTPMHYAYLKIADGCNNRCAFCKIPYIRGNYKSTPKQVLIDEAKSLCEKGVKELILVAQDTTRYGMDTGDNLVSLIKELSSIKNLSWIRLLYCYPDCVTDELINEIKTNPKVLKYIDIPLQHISNNVLVSMHRKSRKEQILNLISTLREQIPNIVIRSTFMVGFPGESEQDFEELCDFLREYKLDNVGFFKYSREEGTPSFDYKNQISEKEKNRRLKIAQEIQEEISTAKNRAKIGQTIKVLTDSFDKDHLFFVGRSYAEAPDIDYEVLFTSPFPLKLGAFYDVEILDFDKGYFIGKVNKRTTY